MNHRSLVTVNCVLLSLSGCLSLDAIPVDTPDASETDASALVPDVSAPTASEGTATSEPASKLPECTDGQRSACTYVFSQAHGEVGRVTQGGDYMYWIELGTVDALQNYRYDGVIARARIGEWKRQELLTGLAFYNVDARIIQNPSEFRTSGDYLLWYDGTGHFLNLAKQPFRAEVIDPRPNDFNTCFVVEDAASCPQVWWNSLVRGDFLYATVNYPEGAAISKFALPGQQRVASYRPAPGFLDVAPTGELIGDLTGGYIGVAQVHGDDELRWFARALGTHVTSRNGWLYFTHDGHLKRVRMDGSNEESLGSYPMTSGCERLRMALDRGSMGMVFANADACSWDARIPTATFIPFPAD